MERLFHFSYYLLVLSVFALPLGCTASFPAVLLPERLDGTPYSSVKYSDKTKEKKNNTGNNTEPAEMFANKEPEQKPAKVSNRNEAELFSSNQPAPQFTQNFAQLSTQPLAQPLPQYTAPQTAYNQYQGFQNPQQNPPSPQVAETPAEDIETYLKTQRGDSRQLRHLLADLMEIPPEEWKISEKELSERLTAFRQTMKNEKNTELESLYLKQLRNAVLPKELTDSAVSEEVAAKDSSKDNTAENVSEVITETITEKDITPKKTAPSPKYGQLAQINERSKQPENVSNNTSNNDNNIVPASYTANPNVPQPLPLLPYSSEYSTVRWEQQIRIGTDMLRREIEQTPSGRTFENEIKLRLLELALGNRNEAVIPFTTEEKRFTDAWGNIMLGISTLYDSAAVPDRKKRISSAAFRFDECSTAMNQFCPIRLRNVQLVKSWLGFGAFEPKEDVCICGEEVGVYLELENPSIKRSAKGYNVSTAITYEIRDMTANIIEKSDKIYAEDTAPSLRRDNCVHFKILLPQTLPQGQYQLRINVTDMNSENMQYAEEQIPLRVRTGTPAEQAR